MGWDFIIVPSSKETNKNLVPVGYVEYKKGTIEKDGNDKIIVANDGDYSKEDKKIINNFIAKVEKFKKPKWL